MEVFFMKNEFIFVKNSILCVLRKRLCLFKLKTLLDVTNTASMAILSVAEVVPDELFGTKQSFAELGYTSINAKPGGKISGRK
jgi:hypothetical protein